jgi:hypothetical protein
MAVARLIQPATTNSKLKGRSGIVEKGRLKGLPMFSLTLEERKTCPRSCQQWNSCYGNNMPFANRIDHTHGAFESRLTLEIKTLLTKYPQGILLRLHVLGDFFSVGYVNFWRKLRKQNPTLQIFGYTHRVPSSSIGKAIQKLNSEGAWIRWSDPERNRKQILTMGATVISADQQEDGRFKDGIVCPEQTGKTAGCATCGLCWAVKKEILFLRH